MESLRRSCVDLLRLRADFSASLERYDKLDKVVQTAALEPLRDTVVQLYPAELVNAVGKPVSLIQQSARPLANTHDVTSHERLVDLMLRHFEWVSN